MFVVELMAGWVIFLQFFEAGLHRFAAYFLGSHGLPESTSPVCSVAEMDTETEEVFDQSENFWSCIFWDVVFHLLHACNQTWEKPLAFMRQAQGFV